MNTHVIVSDYIKSERGPSIEAKTLGKIGKVKSTRSGKTVTIENASGTYTIEIGICGVIISKEGDLLIHQVHNAVFLHNLKQDHYDVNRYEEAFKE